MVKINVFIFLLCCISFSSFGQNRYAIHYKFKPHQHFSLDQPNDFLLEKSTQRRIKQQIPLDSLDLPVADQYLQEIKPFIQQLHYSSNWLNASLVVAHEEQVVNIEALPFVEKVVLAAPGVLPEGRLASGSGKKVGASIKSKTNRTLETSEYVFQNELLGIPQMHEMGFTGEGITVAVFDAGFPGVNQIPAFRHLFENGKLIGTKDYVDINNKDVFTKNQHGTNVLSLIAANSPADFIAGSPDAEIILCITEDGPTEFRIEEYNWVKAAEFADSLGVDIINSSLGYWDFDDPRMNYSFEDMDGKTAIVSLGASIAAKKGILVVTSAGNYGSRGASSITPPADAVDILAIGAINSQLNRVGFSSQGPTADGRIKPDVTTFGEQVYLIRSSGAFGRANGTSFSAPQVAAMSAGLWQAMPDLTVKELIAKIKESSSMADSPNNQVGYGIPNFSKAYLGNVLQILPEERGAEFLVFPNPIEGLSLKIRFGKQNEGEFSLFNMQGQLVQQSKLSRDDYLQPFEVSIPELTSGMYLVEFQAGNETKRTKLIKR
jgi:serine protease AprX